MSFLDFPLKTDISTQPPQKVLHVDYFNYNHSLTQPTNQDSPLWSRTSSSPTIVKSALWNMVGFSQTLLTFIGVELTDGQDLHGEI